jgi:hypothetical protein
MITQILKDPALAPERSVKDLTLVKNLVNNVSDKSQDIQTHVSIGKLITRSGRDTIFDCRLTPKQWSTYYNEIKQSETNFTKSMSQYIYYRDGDITAIYDDAGHVKVYRQQILGSDERRSAEPSGIEQTATLNIKRFRRVDVSIDESQNFLNQQTYACRERVFKFILADKTKRIVFEVVAPIDTTVTQKELLTVLSTGPKSQISENSMRNPALAPDPLIYQIRIEM